jgi:hypothetical protein
MPNDMMEMPLTMGQMRTLAALLMNRKIAYRIDDCNNVKFVGASEMAQFSWKCIMWIDGDTVLYHPYKRTYKSARAGNMLDWVGLIIWRLRQGW